MTAEIASSISQQTDSIWTIVSAVGAFASALFAAVTAWLMYSIQRRNELDAARPEITIDGFERGIIKSPSGIDRDIFRFTKVKNEGKGSAYNVHIHVTPHTGKPPSHDWHQAFMGTIVKTIILPGKEFSSQNDISLHWNHVPEFTGIQNKLMLFNVRISCFDSKLYFYETVYQFSVFEKQASMMGADEVAPATHLATRNVTRMPYWKAKFNSRLSRLPLIGKYFQPLWM